MELTPGCRIAQMPQTQVPRRTTAMIVQMMMLSRLDLRWVTSLSVWPGGVTLPARTIISVRIDTR